MRTAFLTFVIWLGLGGSASAYFEVVFTSSDFAPSQVYLRCDGLTCAQPLTMTLERAGQVVATSSPDIFAGPVIAAPAQVGDQVRVRDGSGAETALVTYDGPPTVDDSCGGVSFAGGYPGGPAAVVTATLTSGLATVAASGGRFTATAPRPVAGSDGLMVESAYPVGPDFGVRSILRTLVCPQPVAGGPAPIPTLPLCSIASPPIRRLLRDAVNGLAHTRIGHVVHPGVVLRNVPACERGRVIGRLALAGGRRTVLATGSLKLHLAGPGRVSVRLKPTAAGRKRLAHARRVRVRISATVVDPAGRTARCSRVVTLRR